MDAQSTTIERLLRERVWVRRLARALVRDASTADDLAQQAYLAALESPSTTVRSPRAWLATVVRNLARDRTRAEQRRTRRETAQSGGAPIPPPDDLAARAELTERVARYVLELEEPYRETILLRFYEDLPPREIAAHLGVPVETVRTRTKRAIARLASRLDSDHGGDRRAWAAPLLLLRQPLGWTEAGVTVGGLVAMKKVLALGAVVFVVLMGIVVVPNWMATPDAPPAAQPHALREEPTDPDATSRATLRGTAEEAQESASLAPPDRARWGIVGRVVRHARVPVAGARVRLFQGGSALEPDDVAVTDAAGRFRLRPRGPFEDKNHMFRLAAEDDAGNVASREVWNVETPRTEDVGPRLLRLEAGHDLRLRVEHVGAPVPGAAIRVSNAGYQRHARLAETTTDATGVAHVKRLLPLAYRVRVEAEGYVTRTMLVSLPVRDDGAIRLELERPRRVTVEVVEAPDLRPLEGVEVRLFNRLAWANSSQMWPVDTPEGPFPTTDARGRVEIEGVGTAGTYQVGIHARGYARPSYHRSSKTWRAQTSKTVPIPAGEDLVRIVVPAARRVTWPLVEGDAPIPADGTRVRLDVGRSGARPWGVDEGIVRNGRLVVEGLGESWFKARARTPDGLVARVVAGPKEREGAPLAFWRPRRLEVVVSDAEGVPQPRVSVRLEAADGPQITTPFAHTGEDGVARWEDLPAVRGRVEPSTPPYAALPVDLSNGDQRLEVVVGKPAAREQNETTVHLRLDGQPGLPVRFEIDPTTQAGSIEIVAEDEDTGTLDVLWASTDESGEAAFELDAFGYQPSTFTLTPGQAKIDVEVRRGCALHVALLHDPGQWVRCHLERYVPSERSWRRVSAGTQRPGVNQVPLNPPTVGYERRYDGLTPGRYRILARQTGRTSAEVLLAVGSEPTRLEFDVRSNDVVEGQVVLPEGYAIAESVVVVEGAAPRPWVSVDDRGRFEFPWPEDTTRIRLVVRHPLLQPHASKGRAVLAAPRSDVQLELVRGPVAEVRLRISPSDGSRFVARSGIQVHLLSASEQRVLPARLEATEGGDWTLAFAGYDAGTYTVWADLAYAYAPLRIDNAPLDELGAYLGPFDVTRGSSIRIRLDAPDGKPAALLLANAVFEGTPAHRRDAVDAEVTEIVLQGLEAGRYRLQGGRVDPVLDEPPSDLDEVIEVDGSSTYERVITTR